MSIVNEYVEANTYLFDRDLSEVILVNYIFKNHFKEKF